MKLSGAGPPHASGTWRVSLSSTDARYWLGTYDLDAHSMTRLDRHFPSWARCAIRCTAHRQDGQPCGAWSVRGTAVCRVHGGMSRKVRSAGQRRLAIAAFEKKLARALAIVQARQATRLEPTDDH